MIGPPLWFLALCYNAMALLGGLRYPLQVEGAPGEHPLKDPLQRHGMGTSTPSGEEVAATAPRIPVQRDFVPIVLSIELDAQAAEMDAASLLGVALCLLDLPDEA